MKMLSYEYSNFYIYYRDKMILWLSHLHNLISYIGKMTSLHWFSIQVDRYKIMHVIVFLFQVSIHLFDKS